MLCEVQEFIKGCGVYTAEEEKQSKEKEHEGMPTRLVFSTC